MVRLLEADSSHPAPAATQLPWQGEYVQLLLESDLVYGARSSSTVSADLISATIAGRQRLGSTKRCSRISKKLEELEEKHGITSRWQQLRCLRLQGVGLVECLHEFSSHTMLLNPSCAPQSYRRVYLSYRASQPFSSLTCFAHQQGSFEFQNGLWAFVSHTIITCERDIMKLGQEMRLIEQLIIGLAQRRGDTKRLSRTKENSKKKVKAAADLWWNWKGVASPGQEAEIPSAMLKDIYAANYPWQTSYNDGEFIDPKTLKPNPNLLHGMQPHKSLI